MPRLTTYRAFIDAGWFLDVPPYTALRSDGFSFQKCAKALLSSYRAQFDRRVRAPAPGPAATRAVPSVLAAPAHSRATLSASVQRTHDPRAGRCPHPTLTA